MPMSLRELDGGVTVAVLSGRLDIAGAQEIDMPLNVVAGSKRTVVFDMSAVEFLASMGMRSIVFASKSVRSKRGVCTLVAPAGDVRTALEAAGIDTLIPTFDTLEEAVAAVTAPA